MKTAITRPSPFAAAALHEYGPGEHGLNKVRTDCPKGCCGDGDREEGRCPHGWLTAQATDVARARRPARQRRATLEPDDDTRNRAALLVADLRVAGIGDQVEPGFATARSTEQLEQLAGQAQERAAAAALEAAYLLELAASRTDGGPR